MNIKENFKDYGKVDIQPWLDKVSQIPTEEWDRLYMETRCKSDAWSIQNFSNNL